MNQTEYSLRNMEVGDMPEHSSKKIENRNYQHWCAIDHPRIGFSGDDEMCPLCEAIRDYKQLIDCLEDILKDNYFNKINKDKGRFSCSDGHPEITFYGDNHSNMCPLCCVLYGVDNIVHRFK